MVFSEILKIIPRLDNADLNNMERKLGSRFTKIAKQFGKGLSGALKGGAIAGGAMALIDRLLNPLKEVQEAIEKTLNHSDDLVTNAKQFGTTAGNLAKLQAFGKSTGLDPEALNMLLVKFQTAVAENKQDKTKMTSVAKFGSEKDTAKAFFEFIQALQKTDKNKQLLIQQEVFGEKQILKMSDFLNTDFGSLSKFFKGIDNDKITAAANKLGDLNDLSQTLTAVRELKDIGTKSKIINTGTVNSMEASKAKALQLENERIKNFQSINNMNDKMVEIAANLEKMVQEVFKQIPEIFKVMNLIVSLLQKAAEGWGMLFKMLKNTGWVRKLFGGSDE
jgi:hypothetical protein